MKDIFLCEKMRGTEDGVPLYSKDTYWGKAPASELAAALEVIDGTGWEEFGKRYRNKFDFTLDEDRADWRFNIPLGRDSVVLDIGAGLGRSTIPLARVVRRVVAFDASLLRMRFLKRLAEKNKLSNIDVFVGDIFDLPLRRGSFDLIAMNGILEWVGKTDRFNDPRAAQIACLCICRDLLKPGGSLYVGIENRFAGAYLRGTDHSGLRYTSFLPRIVADLYSRIRGRGRYDTYTYSKSGYEKLFHEAGFHNLDFFLVYPGYNRPKITIPYDDLNVLGYVIKVLLPSGGWKRSLLKTCAVYPALWLYRKVFFSFNIIARP